MPSRPDSNEEDVSDKPAHIQRSQVMSAERLGWVEEAHQQRLEALKAVDDAVARTVKALRRAGELHNTVIIYTSDNGFMLGEHRQMGKRLPYEPSIRVPLMIRGPDFPRGRSTTVAATTIDIAPTVTDIANADPGLVMDGRSLLPVAKNPNPAPWGTRAILLTTGPRTDTSAKHFYWGVRTPNFTYVEYDTGERELYDLRVDPWQLQSSHADPAYAADMTRLATLLQQLKGCAGASCR